MMQHSLYPALYDPIEIGPVEIKNRIFVSPHGSFAPLAPPEYGLDDHIYARDPADGSPIPHPHVIDYYEERARGGAGLITLGHVEVQKGGTGRYHLTTDSATATFVPLVERIHQYGTKVFVELHCGYDSPSGIPGAGFVGTGFPKALSVADIKRIVQLVGLSAKNAVAAGMDGVELHAAHLHSVGPFLSGFTNRRTDEYGGSLDNRMRFAIECLEAIRENVGTSVAVGIRMNCDEQLPDGIDAEEASEIARRLEELQLLDYFSLDIGHSQHMWHTWGPHYLPESYEVPAIAKVRAAIRNAVVLGNPGRLRDPAEAERIIQSGAMDMVGGVRGFFADPEWPKKGLELRTKEIRPCVGLNGCVSVGSCVVNPTNYLETLYGVTKVKPAEEPKRVVVVGGGPSGMEAARVAALRGHVVTLIERDETLGGALKLHAKIPTHEVTLEAVDWWAAQLDDLGVKVELGRDATVDEVLTHSPDVVVLAAGASYEPTGINGLTAREIPGWDRDFVYTPETLLPAIPKVRRNVVVLDDDGWVTASEIAWIFAQRRAASVELVTRHAATAQSYVDKVGSHRDLVEMLLARHNVVRRSAQTFIRDIGDHRVTLFDTWTNAERVVEDVDVVVLCTLRKSRTELADELRARGVRLEIVGDARRPGRMPQATRDGFFMGWNL
ncbi:oxidoreductase [Streptomyces acidicola]|uniref:oxidoreductase n=1 Tax=Streptomyces acidicola TaxID=2596892 RepID=UPI0037F5A948